ncbi:MAG TPA: family 10 glycosylhydrolase [Puia sp.]|nr:family 10 glycosylhydrolase [Puia sp.]
MSKFVLLALAMLLFVSSSREQPPYEFRAAWIATVDNIDWPTKGNYNTDSQRVEFVRMLDSFQSVGINAVIAQVRPAADAFYPSQYEPWSEWLTGRQGQPPIPFYDPLAFMIEEAHRRGMEFHAWCNPYRAVFRVGQSTVAPAHITRIHPEWFLTYGEARYFDPGNKEVQRYVNAVISDIVQRYNVDAIHFDDYFYPYRIAGRDFPDELSYARYSNGLTRDDWRRSNVDSIILMISRTIKRIKPGCKFGISPFGVWRNIDKDAQGSATKAGVTNYEDLYADVLLWLKNGWIDYVAPQLYWEFGHRAAPYEVLLDWWSKHSYGKQCYIGLGFYKAGSNAIWRDKTLLPREILALRNTLNVQGMIFFSAKSILDNLNGWTDSLRNNYFRVATRVPPMPWLDSAANH